jgi:hypothetical protein
VFNKIKMSNVIVSNFLNSWLEVLDDFLEINFYEKPSEFTFKIIVFKILKNLFFNF